MSALPPKADMDQHGRDVRFVPKADISFCNSGDLQDPNDRREARPGVIGF
jgi:hypothetical protein